MNTVTAVHFEHEIFVLVARDLEYRVKQGYSTVE
jgi:hypothetical protein